MATSSLSAASVCTRRCLRAPQWQPRSFTRNVSRTSAINRGIKATENSPSNRDRSKSSSAPRSSPWEGRGGQSDRRPAAREGRSSDKRETRTERRRSDRPDDRKSSGNAAVGDRVDLFRGMEQSATDRTRTDITSAAGSLTQVLPQVEAAVANIEGTRRLDIAREHERMS